jgi:hypothetical protein
MLHNRFTIPLDSGVVTSVPATPVRTLHDIIGYIAVSDLLGPSQPTKG